jgi:hypothetical protein
MSILGSALRPPENVESRVVRISGAIWAISGLLLVTGMIILVTISHGKQGSTVPSIGPIVMLTGALLAGVGLHRLVWGHPESSSNMPHWAKIATSLALVIVCAATFSVVAGIVVAVVTHGR